MPGVPKSRDEWLWGIAPVVQAVECRDRENQCVPFQTWEKAKRRKDEFGEKVMCFLFRFHLWPSFGSGVLDYCETTKRCTLTQIPPRRSSAAPST